jgi:cytochrome c553
MKKLITSMFAVAALSAAAGVSAQEVKGDAKAGEKKIAMCIGCHGIHGYQASFPEVYRVPKISGQSEKFLVSALNAYKQGERKHPTMRGIAESLSDQDMADMAAYYSAHGVAAGAAPAPKNTEPSAKVAELLKKGNCASCHGDNLSKPISPDYPKIGGQYADYLFVALKSYKQEKSNVWGRSNGVMGGIAKQFSNAELKELSNYIAAQQGDLKTIPQKKFR